MSNQDNDEIINTCSEPLMGNVPKITNRDCSTTDFYQRQSTLVDTFGHKNNKNHVRLVEKTPKTKRENQTLKNLYSNNQSL